MQIYRGYVLLSVGSGIEIYHGMETSLEPHKVIDLAPDMQAARDIIDGWLNAP